MVSVSKTWWKGLSNFIRQYFLLQMVNYWKPRKKLFRFSHDYSILIHNELTSQNFSLVFVFTHLFLFLKTFFVSRICGTQFIVCFQKSAASSSMENICRLVNITQLYFDMQRCIKWCTQRTSQKDLLLALNFASKLEKAKQQKEQ